MEYFYLNDNNQQMGPLSIDLLVTQIRPETLIWSNGMADWAPASSVPEVAHAMTFGGPRYSQQQPSGSSGYYDNSQAVANNYGSDSSQNATPMSMPNSYKIYSILALVGSIIFCAPIAAILSGIAIYKSIKCDKAIAAGNIDEANELSKSAKIFIIVAVAIAVVAVIIDIIIGFQKSQID